MNSKGIKLTEDNANAYYQVKMDEPLPEALENQTEEEKKENGQSYII